MKNAGLLHRADFHPLLFSAQLLVILCKENFNENCKVSPENSRLLKQGPHFFKRASRLPGLGCLYINGTFRPRKKTLYFCKMGPSVLRASQFNRASPPYIAH